MSNYYLYEHVAPNGKRYFGITCQIPERRWRADGSGYRQNQHFMNAIHKYGWDNFEHNILYSGLSQEEACAKEIELIHKYQTSKSRYGYNRSKGGDHGELDIESRKHISESVKKLWEDSQYRQHMSDAHKGQRREGWHHSEETKALMSAIVTKRHKDPEYLNRLSESARKRSERPEQRERLQRIAKEAWKTEEYRNKIIASLKGNHYRAKRVLCVETGKVFESTKEAAQSIGVARETIGQVCRGEREMTHGCHWRFVDG